MIASFIRHATTVLLLVLCVVLFGMQSYATLPRESAPDIKIPVVVVTTPYHGVSPSDIEGLITVPMENELASLTDVKKMSSSSAEGMGVVTIEFEPEVDIDEALQKVRDRVSRARSKLPSDVKEPTVQEISFSDMPILLLTLAGDVDEQRLKQIGEDLSEDITRIPGVLDSVVTGGLEREIRIQIYPERLNYYGLSMRDVIGAISDENVNVPGGDVTVGDATYLLRVPSEFTAASQIESVAVKRVGEQPVFVRDLARVIDGFEDRATYSRMNGATSVTVSVTKRTGANMLEVADAVKALAAAEAPGWPDGVRWRILGDQSEQVESMVSELQNGIATALVLVLGVIFAFMGLRNSLFVALAIPLSMLMSFVLVDALGYTLNMIVLFSLILALGMLVDNAIVVVENIYRHMELGKDPDEAAIVGTKEVAGAVAASTATTVAAFFPMIFWTGIMGQFMGYLPKTVIIVLGSSLVVAVLVLPVAAAQWMRAESTSESDDDDAQPIDPATLPPIMQRYVNLLKTSIHRRYVSLAVGVGVLVGTMAIYSVLGHGVEFFPATEPDRAVVGVRLAEGADLEATDVVVRRIENILAQTENVDVYVAETGVAASQQQLFKGSNRSNAAKITVDFLPSGDKALPGEKVRVEDTWDTIASLRSQFGQIIGAKITIDEEEMGPPVGDPIAVEVSGEDFDEVGEVAIRLMRDIAEIEGTTELEHDYRVGRPEMRLRIDRASAKRVGVNSNVVGDTVRTAVAGTKASVMRDGKDEYDILVEVAPEYRNDLSEVLRLFVPGREDRSPDTYPVPLSSVAHYELAGGSGTIKHVDQDLVVTIKGSVTDPSIENATREKVAALIADWPAPEGINLRLGGADDEQRAAEEFLSWAFGLAVALIAIVLVSEFNSFATPLIIMITVVLSLVGVLWGLILTGTPFGIIMTGIGVISLAGVVVNNAIVLLDYVEQLRARGMPVEDALVRAGVTRFRPVMLTAITTTLGLVPMAIGTSFDFTKFKLIIGSSSAQFWGPMAVAIIFGLVFATVLTLVMVPTLYGILEDLRRVYAGWRSKGDTAVRVAATTLLCLLVIPDTAHAVTLDEAWVSAEQHNLSLALVRESEVQARMQRWQALTALMPQVSLQAEYALNEDEFVFAQDSDFSDLTLDPAVVAPLVTHPDSPFTLDYINDALVPGFGEIFGSILAAQQGDEPVVVQAKSVWTGSLTISQTLWNSSAIPGYTAAQRGSRAAALDIERARDQIRGGVAQAFYGLATARAALELSESTVSLTKHQLDLAKRQVQAGLADRRAELQAELALARSERDVMAARESLVDAEESFAHITGLDRDVELELPPQFKVPLGPDAAVTKALQSRPDIEAARFRERAVKAQKVAQNFGWIPTLSGVFNYRYNSVPGFIPEKWQWRLGVNMNWNLFDGGLRIAKSKSFDSQRRAQMLQIRQLEQNTEQEIRTNWERLERSDQSLTSVQKELELALENVRLAEASFEAGSATWLEVEQARMSLDSVKLSEIRERMNRDLAAIQLLVSTGSI